MRQRQRPRPTPEEEIDGDLIMAGSPFDIPESAAPPRRRGLGDAVGQGELRRFATALLLLCLGMLGLTLAMTGTS
jgi:hypothetical protein